MKVSFSKTLEQANGVAVAAEPDAPVIDVQATAVGGVAPEAVAPKPVQEAGPEPVVTSTTIVEGKVVETRSDPVSEIPTRPAGQVNGNAVAVVPNTPTAVVQSDSPSIFNDEDIGFDDIRLPRLNIVQKVGDLSNIFTPGEIVLNQSAVIHEPADPVKNKVGNKPLIITVLGFKKRQFCEKVVGGDMGLLVNTEAEVVAKGGTLDYKEWQQSNGAKKYFQRLATALLLVQKPEHYQDTDDLMFPYECEGKKYALALYSMKGTSYTNAAKHIYTARKIGHLRPGYPVQAWSLTTKLEKFGDNYAHIPIIKPGPKSTEAFLTFAREVLGAGK